MNPWNNIDLDIYEKHMEMPDVFQLQTLNAIMRRQLAYNKPVVAILGAAGGNGLNHIDLNTVRKVYAVDINAEFLAACQKRYGFLKDVLETICCDLSADEACLPRCGLLICNLIIEYIGIEKFTALLKRNYEKTEIVSCVIQHNANEGFVSASPYAGHFEALVHQDIHEAELTEALKDAGYAVLERTGYPLPNQKELIRMDFCRNA